MTDHPPTTDDPRGRNAHPLLDSARVVELEGEAGIGVDATTVAGTLLAFGDALLTDQVSAHGAGAGMRDLGERLLELCHGLSTLHVATREDTTDEEDR